MPHHQNIRLRRALTAACLVAAITAGIVLAAPSSDTAHPPERIHTANPTVVINPTALPALVAPTTSSTTTTAPPPPTTRPAHAAHTATTPPATGDVHAAIAHWFGDIYGQAVAVANCESRLTPTARGGPNYGLFQISSVHADAFANVTGVGFYEGWWDPELNAQYARHLYDEQGWGPWACRWAAG